MAEKIEINKLKDNSSLESVVSSVDIINDLLVRVVTTSKDGKYELITNVYCFPKEIIRAKTRYEEEKQKWE